MDSDIAGHKTPLGQVTQILYDNPNVSFDRLIEATQNATATAVQLNETLSLLGILDIDAVTLPLRYASIVTASLTAFDFTADQQHGSAFGGVRRSELTTFEHNPTHS